MTATPRILMHGFYGHGNFGDDVLMRVTYSLLKQACPDAHISVLAENYHGDYITPILGNVAVLPHGRHGHAELIVHGGGGVFFDLKPHGALQRLWSACAGALGWGTYLAAEKTARRLLGKSRTTATQRIGLGIGVGTFTPGSPRLRAKLPILADFDVLWLRDAQSVENLKPFSKIMKAELIAGSDLAFLSEHWLPTIPPRPAATRPRLGLALRDWSGNDPAALEKIFAQLAKDYDLTGFIFDQNADPQMQQLLAPYTTHIWHPKRTSMDAFSKQLAAQDVLLTSRAHGAICGACLGVPSVIVEIDQKLTQVHTMLSASSILVPPHVFDQWPAAIQSALAIPADRIAADVANNRAASAAAWSSIQRYLP